MKTTNRLVALLLALIMVISCAPLSIFAADTTTLSYESEIYEDETLEGYKQYEAMWNDPTYVKNDVKYTVYFDKENATTTRDVVFYVINWNGERIGTDSDIDIVSDLIQAPASVESGNRWAVVVVDFGGNPLSKAPNIEMSLGYLREALPGASKLTVWKDSTHTTTTTVPVHKSHVYMLPAGYRVARDIPYFETDYHASLGTRNYVMGGWNSHIAGKKTVYYAYHTGDENCSFDHTANAGVECIAGAPQEINGKVVAYAAGQKAPTVSRPADCRKKDGSPLDYVCRLDIIYPSGEDVEATPVMVQAATQSPRMDNIGTVSSKDYDGDGVASLKMRTMLVGMEFCGYTVAVYDYAYSPMARGDHYGYIDPYGAHGSNAAKTSRAAIRCIRYFAEEYGYNDQLIGAAGISKGTPTTAVLSTVDNKYVNEGNSFTYDIYGDGKKVNTRGLWYEGDIGDDGLVPEGTTETKIVQPYLTYEAGYNGKNIDADKVNYEVSKTGEISSEVNVVYCAAGDGINRVYSGDQSIIVGGTNPTTGKETQHVPMILSCGYYDEYGCWNHWPGIQSRFTAYAKNPFIAIGMEDMGHDYPSGIDPMRDYDRYNAYMQFFHSILKPELYTPQVAWMMPVDGAKNVPVGQNVQVQLIKPAESLAAFIAATTVKDSYGNSVEGAWSTNDANTSGLYTFTPTNGYLGGTTYTVTVGTPVVATTTSKSFTAEAAGFLRPVADTYISAANKSAVYGSEKTLFIDKHRTYLATFNTADFEDANKAYLNLSLVGAGNQTVSVYLLDGFEVDESKTCYNNTPELTDDKLIVTYDVSEGDAKLDLLGLIASVKEDCFTIAVSGTAHYFELNFEDYTKTTSVGEYDNNVVDTVDTTRTHYYSYADESKITPLKTRRGGGLGTRQIKSHSDEMVFSVPTSTSYDYGGFLKFYNSISDSNVTDAIGKTFKYSVNVKLDGDNSVAEASETKPKITAGIIRSGNNKFLTSKALTYTELKSNNWLTISGEYTISAANVAEKVTSSNTNRYSYPMFGMEFEHVNVKKSGIYTYLVDDITVQEVAPTALTSRENTSTHTAYITTATVDESGAVADTYVSKTQPDFVFGNNDRLLVNGGDNENITFLTYSAKILNGKDNIQLTIPAEDNASFKTEILLLDGYYVNEETLTYSNMPDLDKAISLGEYTLKGGVNTVEIESAVEKITAPYFTLVLKAVDSIEVIFSQNFEDYKLGTNVEAGSNNVTDTGVTNADGKTYQYYYGHREDTSIYIARKGGATKNIGNILADPDNSQNKVVDIHMNKYKYTGRAKFFNSISDSIMTSSDPLIGQTLRFTARVKAANDVTVLGGGKAFASAILSAATSSLADANNVKIESKEVAISDKWQLLSVDYTVRAEDIKANSKADGNPAWGYPMFNLDFGASTSQVLSYYFDDLTVVKLNSDGTVSRLDMASSESADHVGETIGVRARSAKDPIADTYISAMDKTGVFGYEKTLYADSQRTYLATFKSSDFTVDEKGYLDLSLLGTGSQTISAYYLDNFKVDENTTCYNNTPELTEDKLIGTYNALKGEKKIHIGTILENENSEYFTIAIKGSARYYELNFEDYTATTTVSEYDHNVADSVNTDRYHLYGFAPDNKLKPLTSRRGGALGTRKITSVAGDMVLSVSSSTEQTYSGFMKFYNFIQTSADDDIAGITFNYSIDIKLTGDNSLIETSTYKPMVKAGIMCTGSNDFLSSRTLSCEDLTENLNSWKTVSGQYTVPASEIAKPMTSEYNPKNRYSYPILGMEFQCVGALASGAYTYYVDNMIVSEEAPSAISALDDTMGETACIVTGSDVVADTYISRGNPDTCYGNEEVLRIGDEGGDKKALVLSFMNSAIDNDSYIDLKLDNSGDTLKDVSVYYVLDYCADESTLTWNTMPEYEDNLLGKYDLVAGRNQIDLSALRGKLTGDYFTLVLRTESHSFLENFQSYKAGYNYYDNQNKDNNVADPDNSTNIFYHGFHTLTGMSRRGGNLGSRYVIADADNADNLILKIPTVKSNGDGLLKFYNTMNYEAITKESDIVGKTLRFSFKAKADLTNCNPDALATLELKAGAMTSWTSNYINQTIIGSTDLQSGWKTYTVDYTVKADDIGKVIHGQTWTTNPPSWQDYTSYPMFSINFGDDETANSYHMYHIDDLSVVEVVDGKVISDAIFGSREANSTDIGFVSAFNNNVTIIETTVSNATTGDVISIVDSGKTYSLLTAENGKLVFGNTVICDEDGNDIILTETPVKVVAIYNDANGTARFAVGDFLAYYKDAEGAVQATFEHLMIEGGVGDNAKLGIKGTKATKLANPTSEILGFQTNYIEKAVRFVSGVDTIYYNAVGFKLEGTATEKSIGSKTVYSSIIGDDKDIFAKDYGYNLMSAISLTEVNVNGTVKVTPYLRVGDNYIYGESVFYKIAVAEEITVTEIDESEFGTQA